MDQNIVSKIIIDLSTNPNSTIEQVSTRLSYSKGDVKKVIENLVNDSIVINDNNYYSLSEVLLNSLFTDRSDIYFNLNLPKEAINNIYSLFNFIEKQWISITGKKPSKVQMQKTAVEFIDKFGINAPTGWYLYGKITPVSYNPEKNYHPYNNIDFQNIEKEAINLVLENTGLNPKMITKKQYSSGDSNFHKLYRLKTEILEDIQNNNTVAVLNKFNEFKYMLVDYLDSNLLNKYYSFLLYYERLAENKKDAEVKNIYYSIFNCLWDIVAIYNYRLSLDSYYTKNNIDPKDLNLKLLVQTNIILQKFNELLTTFYESFKITDFYNDPATKKLVDKVLSI